MVTNMNSCEATLLTFEVEEIVNVAVAVEVMVLVDVVVL